jgi:diguanylate cyclase (GGDEF)-like protein
VLLCDLDYFKAINDTHGHSTGDLVLTEIARVLGKHGIAGRLGGDEFALWLSGDRPGHVADAIVAEVTATFPEGSDLAVGISVGIATAARICPTRWSGRTARSTPPKPGAGAARASPKASLRPDI